MDDAAASIFAHSHLLHDPVVRSAVALEAFVVDILIGVARSLECGLLVLRVKQTGKVLDEMMRYFFMPIPVPPPSPNLPHRCT